jgi:hypothetical protein
MTQDTVNIISLLGLEAWPTEKKLALLEKMNGVVMQRVMLRVLDRLEGSDAQEADRLADQPDALADFLTSKAPDMSALITEEVEKLKADLVKGAKQKYPEDL